MKTITVKDVDVSQSEEMEKKSIVVLNDCKNIVISDQLQYEWAGNFLKDIKNRASRIETERKKITRGIDAVKKSVMDLFRPATDNYNAAENTLKKAILVYQDEQEKIRRDNEAKLQHEAEKKRQDALKKADEFKEKGNDKKAHDWLNKANDIVTPTLGSRVEDVEGIATKKIWKFRVINKDLVPRQYLIVDEKAMGIVVRGLKDNTVIPGIEVYFEKSIAAGK